MESSYIEFSPSHSIPIIPFSTSSLPITPIHQYSQPPNFSYVQFDPQATFIPTVLHMSVNLPLIKDSYILTLEGNLFTQPTTTKLQMSQSQNQIHQLSYFTTALLVLLIVIFMIKLFRRKPYTTLSQQYQQKSNLTSMREMQQKI